MAKSSLREFEKKIRLRRLANADFDRIVELQTICFPKMEPWTREQYENQITTFPEGQLCIDLDGEVVASSSALIVDFDLYSDWHDWKLIADNGSIRNHDSNGDALYGIEIMVHPKFRGMDFARRMYDARKALCRQMNLTRMILGGRIPGYHEHSKKLSVRQYVAKVVKKEFYDPVLSVQLANDFTLQRLIPDYLPSDEDSAGFATHMEWVNLAYQPNERRRIDPVQNIRIASVQYQMRKVASFDEFAQQVAFFVDVASDYRSDFVMFPELFTLQLLSITKAREPGRAARKLAELTPKYLDLMTRLAIKHNVNIIGGSQFTLENGHLYNVAYLFRRNGTIGKQYKIHLTPDERSTWGVEGGDRIEVFDTDRGRIAINICYDIEFPELARICVKKGAQILFVPFNTDTRQAYLRVRHCALARCVENHVYVALSGCTGNLPDVENADIHYAESAIFTPTDVGFPRDGVAGSCEPNLETLVVQDVDVELLRRHRYKGTTQNWNDRRRDLLSVHYKNPNGEDIKV
ncbi:MAG TPA: GNAT family N-acetyltransferase [Polyangiaceae bacterium]|jgi:predicted amidohydrolase/ribosomal protein S18 acetylase RimI-like enzyme|nr:GNAT family N-acetyltransferase [Polyangiaceae bacterium]